MSLLFWTLNDQALPPRSRLTVCVFTTCPSASQYWAETVALLDRLPAFCTRTSVRSDPGGGGMARTAGAMAVAASPARKDSASDRTTAGAAALRNREPKAIKIVFSPALAYDTMRLARAINPENGSARRTGARQATSQGRTFFAICALQVVGDQSRPEGRSPQDMAEPPKSVLFLSMCPLDVLDRAPRVRSYHLWRELDQLVPTTLVAGRRGERLLKLLSLTVTGRLFRFAAVYVETATASATPADLLALAVLRLLGRPIFIYIRDAYQLFPAEFPPRTIRRKVSYCGWRFSVGVYKRVAARLLFPPTAPAELFDLEDRRWGLLPPAGAPLVAAARHLGTR